MRVLGRRAGIRVRPAVTGTVRVTAPTGPTGRSELPVLPDLSPGDVLVVDLADLQRATAEAIVEAQVSAVVNVGRLATGHYASLGPGVLARADVVWIDAIGRDAAEHLVDGARVRLSRGAVHLLTSDGEGQPVGPVATGRELDLSLPAPADVEAADRPAPGPARVGRRPTPRQNGVQRAGVAGSDDVPHLRTEIDGRPALLVASAHHADLRILGRFVRDRTPVLVAVGRAADAVLDLGWVPDVVVLGAGDDVPSQAALSRATDVVIVGGADQAETGTGRSDEAQDSLRDPAHGARHSPEQLSAARQDARDRLARRQDAHRLDTAESAAVVAVRLLERCRASVVVAVGVAPVLIEHRSTPVLDARTVADLSGRRRPRPGRVVLLALVLLLGVALGAGVVAVVRDPPQSESTTRRADPAETSAGRQAEADERDAQRLVDAVGPRLYGTGLTGHGVSIIALPGASPRQVTALSDQVRDAGGAASRSVVLQQSLVDSADRSQVDATGARLLTQLADPRLDPGATTYVRMGQLLALATTTSTTPASSAADPVALATRQELRSADLAHFPDGMRLTPTVLLVLPSDARSDPAGTELLAGLVAGLATLATVVVVGDTVSGQAGGALTGLRAQTLPSRVSTVDGIDQPTGRLSTVLTLEAALVGTAGDYGATGSDGPVPSS